MKIDSDTFFRRVLVLCALILGQTAARSADSIADHQVAQGTPISLGTSGGNVKDISMLYCCSGTLGALVQDSSGVQYILSNNHVLGKANRATVGDDISQPGLIDNNCAPGTPVADLTAYVPLKFKTGKNGQFNQVDAAIAQIRPNAVDPYGDIIGIGGVSGTILSRPELGIGQAVQKSGRTTGLTFGTVSAFDVVVDVGYSDSCGGPAKYVARFNNQIVINGGTFSAGGDSGSLIVEAGTSDSQGLPRAVGLLFAGSSSSTIANPIGDVLAQLGAASGGKTLSMVQGTAPPAAFGSVSGTVYGPGDSLIGGASVSSQSGQSTTSGPNGTYTLTGVPMGSASITASAVGYNSQTINVQVQEGQTTPGSDFHLSTVSVATKALVKCVSYQLNGAKNKNLLVTVSVVDDLGQPIDGATVSITLTRNGGGYANGSGTTAGGKVTFNASNAPDGTYATTVTGISKTGLTFVSGTPVNSFIKGGNNPTTVEFCTSAAGSTEPMAEPETVGNGRAHAERVVAIKGRHSDELFNVPDVVGHGVGQGANGELVIEVYLSKDNGESRRVIPPALEGVPVRVIVTGPFEAY